MRILQTARKGFMERDYRLLVSRDAGRISVAPADRQEALRKRPVTPRTLLFHTHNFGKPVGGFGPRLLSDNEREGLIPDSTEAKVDNKKERNPSYFFDLSTKIGMALGVHKRMRGSAWVWTESPTGSRKTPFRGTGNAR